MSRNHTKATNSQKLRDALSQKGIQDIHSYLTEEELVAALSEEGVTDLPSLVRRLNEDKVTVVRSHQQREGISFADVMRPTSQELAATIVHPTPKMPVYINGVEYDPKDIQRFNGQELHFVLLHQSFGPALLALPERGQLANLQVTRALARLGVAPLNWPPDPPPPYPPPTPNGSGLPAIWGCGYAGLPPCGSGHITDPPQPPSPPFNSKTLQMFDDSDYRGNWFWLQAGYQWSDLTKVNRARVLVFSSDWNDVISSLASTDTTCQFYEHINLQGSSLTIPPYKPVPNLSDLGWNDRISSVVNWG